MEPIYQQEFHINDAAVDCFGRLKPSMLLFYIQEVAGTHAATLGAGFEALVAKNLFWAILRTKVQITRLPHSGETIRLETWPMPTSRVAYPRSVVAYDEQGEEIFRCINLWVLMDLNSRAMILPGKSGISVEGTLRGNELAAPGSLAPKALNQHRLRPVCFTDLDRNGHMNNTRYLDWLFDLLPAEFHREHPVKEFTVCYLSEAREGQEIVLNWQLSDGPVLQVNAHREKTGVDAGKDRVFAAQVIF